MVFKTLISYQKAKTQSTNSSMCKWPMCTTSANDSSQTKPGPKHIKIRLSFGLGLNIYVFNQK